MISEVKVRQAVEQQLENSGLFLVDVKVSAAGKIVVEIDSDEGVKIAECAALSRHLNTVFDREQQDYELQVSSPGLDKPLKVKRQYLKNVGREVQVTTTSGNTITGVLTRADEKGIELHREEKVKKEKKKILVKEDIPLDFSEITETKVIVKFK